MSRLGHMLCRIKEDLKNLRKELTVGGTSLSLRKYVETLQEKYESKVVQDLCCDLKVLTQMTRDDVGSALIPREELEGEMEALKASGDGNCLFNSASILIEGGESANHVLRLLTPAELFMNPQYYAHHPKLTAAKAFLSFSDITLFSLLLSDSGQKEFEKKGSRVDAIQAEAKATCKLGKWGTFLDMMALATALKRPLFSLYPLFEGNKGIRPLLNGLLQPRVTSEKDSEAFYILWSREGGFDNQPGVVFQPNHFVPVIPHLSRTQPGMTASKDTPSLKIKASSSSGKQQGISAFFQPGKHALKRSSSQACLTSVIENGSVQSKKVPKKPVATVRKFQDSWKVEFPWVIHDASSNTMFCDFCQKAGAKVAGKTDFVSGSKTFKKETLKKHGESQSHLRARDFVINEQRPTTQGPLFKGLKKAAEKVEEQAFQPVSVKMNTAYFIAKEELPFTKFPGLLQLQQKNGVKMSNTYASDTKCAEMVSKVATLIKKENAFKLQNEARYISVMIDGDTDTSSMENEIVYTRCVSSGRPVNLLVGHKPVEHAHAEGKYKFSRSTTMNVIGVLYENTKHKKTKLLIIKIKSYI